MRLCNDRNCLEWDLFVGFVSNGGVVLYLVEPLQVFTTKPINP